MFNMRVGDAIYTLIEAIFPRPPGEGLLITLDLRLEHPKDRSRHTSGNVSFVFERPYSNCRVWTGVTYTGFNTPELTDWEMISDHDSVWRNAVDSEITKEYFRQAHKISKQMAPVRMTEMATSFRSNKRLRSETLQVSAVSAGDPEWHASKEYVLSTIFLCKCNGPTRNICRLYPAVL